MKNYWQNAMRPWHVGNNLTTYLTA